MVLEKAVFKLVGIGSFMVDFVEARRMGYLESAVEVIVVSCFDFVTFRRGLSLDPALSLPDNCPGLPITGKVNLTRSNFQNTKPVAKEDSGSFI